MKVQQPIEAAVLERQVITTAAVQDSDHECPGSVSSGYSVAVGHGPLMAGTASSRPFH
jgi:hypothetical protein